MNYMNDRHLLQHSDLAALIESACQSLEISSSQNELARKRYEAVGDWLSRADNPLLATIAIRLQGSVAIGTTVKPIGANEYDVDLVAHVGDLDVTISPASLKKSIGDRLRSNRVYADLLEEMPKMLAAELRQRISSGYHAFDFQTRLAPWAGSLFPTKLFGSGRRPTRKDTAQSSNDGQRW